MSLDGSETEGIAVTRERRPSRFGRILPRTHDRRVAYLLYLPCLIVVLTLGIYPALRVLQFSFHRADIFFTYWEYAGLDSLISVLHWSDFWEAILHDVVFTGSCITIQFILGLGVALLLNQDFPGRNIARGVLLFSYLVPVVVAALVWKFMLNDLFGIANYIIQTLNLPIPTTWFSAVETAMPSVILVTVWYAGPDRHHRHRRRNARRGRAGTRTGNG
jgi:multiple sugar transport system permease protein